MLENMRRQGASIFVYLIFCVLIVIFVINIGPQTGQRAKAAALGQQRRRVGQRQRGDADRLSHRLLEPVQRAASKQKTWVAIEMLIRREILAQEAEGAA